MKRIVAALLLFAVSFGCVEAAVVVYLRALYDPIRQQIHPDAQAGELFPLIRLDELEALGPVHIRRFGTELVREAATLILLVSVALAVGRNFRQWLAAFVIAFGLWDIFYYVFLKLLIGWPTSLLTWDILLLLPVPWVGPVLAPGLVSAAMIGAGLVVLWRESVGRPVKPAWYQWAAIVAGGLIIVAALCWDFRNTSAGGYPNPFNWPLFAFGLLTGLTAFATTCRSRQPESGGIKAEGTSFGTG